MSSVCIPSDVIVSLLLFFDLLLILFENLLTSVVSRSTVSAVVGLVVRNLIALHHLRVGLW